MSCSLISVFFFSSRRRHTRLQGDWSSDVCSSDLPGVQPGARLLLHTEGENQVRAVLERIDAIEALGIAPSAASPAYWRTLANRLAARLPLPEYTAERHAGWLIGRALP